MTSIIKGTFHWATMATFIITSSSDNEGKDCFYIEFDSPIISLSEEEFNISVYTLQAALAHAVKIEKYIINKLKCRVK